MVKLKLSDNERSRDKSLSRLLGYIDRLLADEGWLVVVDHGLDKSWSEIITWETVTDPAGRTIHVVGC